MRKMMYKVMTANGTTLDTADYSMAMTKGNKVIKSYLIDIDNLDGSPKKIDETHADRVDAYIKAQKEKRG